MRMNNLRSSFLGICVFAFLFIRFQSFTLEDEGQGDATMVFQSRRLHEGDKEMDYNWAQFFAELKEDLIAELRDKENEIHKALYVTQPKHELCERYPLKPIPVVLETAAGICFFGSHLTKGTICENALRGKSIWSPDPHVRDIISTVLLPCSLQSQRHDCFAIDVGSNFGAHTLHMLELGARVVSIEPQIDLCVASRISASALGYANRSHVVCGGMAQSENTPRTSTLNINKDTFLWRYYGDVPHGTEKYGYSIDGDLPLVSLPRLVATKTKVDFLKIDTDSIDCDVLQQAINMM